MELPRLDQTTKMKIKKKRKRSDGRARMKVVYISSPVKVTTPASVFRAIVQELTGRHSDVSRFVEINGHAAAAADNSDFNFNDHNYTSSHGDLHLELEGSALFKSRSSSSSDSGEAALSSSPTSSKSVFDHDAYVESSDLVQDCFFQELFPISASPFEEFNFDVLALPHSAAL